MFKVGHTYKTRGGKDITILSEKYPNTQYHCVEGSDGIWRYARLSDAGRTTGSHGPNPNWLKVSQWKRIPLLIWERMPLYRWRLRAAFFDMIAVREDRKTYLGGGDYDVEFGWLLFGRWVPLTKEKTK